MLRYEEGILNRSTSLKAEDGFARCGKNWSVKHQVFLSVNFYSVISFYPYSKLVY